MPRYWIIAPVESKPPELFDKVWQFDLANNLISIGWEELGDVSKMSREELSVAVASTCPDKPPATKGLYANMLWAFSIMRSVRVTSLWLAEGAKPLQRWAK
jgi:hypothetical protein